MPRAQLRSAPDAAIGGHGRTYTKVHEYCLICREGFQTQAPICYSIPPKRLKGAIMYRNRMCGVFTGICRYLAACICLLSTGWSDERPFPSFFCSSTPRRWLRSVKLLVKISPNESAGEEWTVSVSCIWHFWINQCWSWRNRGFYRCWTSQDRGSQSFLMASRSCWWLETEIHAEV